MSKRNPTFIPGKHTIKEFEPWGIAKVDIENRWLTITMNSAYDKEGNLITHGCRIKIRA